MICFSAMNWVRNKMMFFLFNIHIGYRIQILQLTRSLLKRLAWPGGRSMSAIHLPFFCLLPMGTFWTTYTPHRQKWALFGPHIHLIWFCLRRHWTTPMTHKCKNTKFWKSIFFFFLVEVTVNVTKGWITTWTTNF